MSARTARAASDGTSVTPSPAATGRDRAQLRRPLAHREVQRGLEVGLQPVRVEQPVLDVGRDVVARYEDLGVSRLVLLPEPEVARADRHRAVPLERLLGNIEWAARELLPR